MTVINAPGTFSPGKLALSYSVNGFTHQCSVNFIDGVDLNDISTIAIDADHLSDLVVDLLPANGRIYGYKVLSPTGQTLYASSFASVKTGTHPQAGQFPPFNSPTIKILGRGVPTNVLLGSGVTSLMIFTGWAYGIIPDEKYISNPDAPLAALIADLDSYLRYWADFYGQHADTTGRVAVQFNAHEQKRNGS